MHLIDTKVISEIRKGDQANVGVRQFFDANKAECHSVIQWNGASLRKLGNGYNRDCSSVFFLRQIKTPAPTATVTMINIKIG